MSLLRRTCLEWAPTRGSLGTRSTTSPATQHFEVMPALLWIETKEGFRQVIGRDLRGPKCTLGRISTRRGVCLLSLSPFSSPVSRAEQMPKHGFSGTLLAFVQAQFTPRPIRQLIGNPTQMVLGPVAAGCLSVPSFVSGFPLVFRSKHWLSSCSKCSRDCNVNCRTHPRAHRTDNMHNIWRGGVKR